MATKTKVLRLVGANHVPVVYKETSNEYIEQIIGKTNPLLDDYLH